MRSDERAAVERETFRRETVEQFQRQNFLQHELGNPSRHAEEALQALRADLGRVIAPRGRR